MSVFVAAFQEKTIRGAILPLNAPKSNRVRSFKIVVPGGLIGGHFSAAIFSKPRIKCNLFLFTLQ